MITPRDVKVLVEILYFRQMIHFGGMLGSWIIIWQYTRSRNSACNCRNGKIVRAPKYTGQWLKSLS